MTFLFKPKPRCFEKEIEELVQHEKKQYDNQFGDVPMILFMSIEILQEQTFKSGIFRISGNQNVIKKLVTKCDSVSLKPNNFKKELEKEVQSSEGQFAIASLMKKYLLTLPEPIVNYDLYPKFLEANEIEDEEVRVKTLKECVEKLSPIRKNTMKKIINLLYKIHLDSENTKMSASNLAKAVGGSIIRSQEQNSITNLGAMKSSQSCVEQIILNYDYMFEEEPEETELNEVEIEHPIEPVDDENPIEEPEDNPEEQVEELSAYEYPLPHVISKDEIDARNNRLKKVRSTMVRELRFDIQDYENKHGRFDELEEVEHETEEQEHSTEEQQDVDQSGEYYQESNEYSEDQPQEVEYDNHEQNEEEYDETGQLEVEDSQELAQEPFDQNREYYQYKNYEDNQNEEEQNESSDVLQEATRRLKVAPSQEKRRTVFGLDTDKYDENHFQ